MKWVGGSWLAAAAIAVASLATAASADARVKREGVWPDADKPVTLDADGLPRRDALRKLADAAGWSLVVHAPPGDPVDVHVKGQPASKVLEILLDDGDYTVRRDGTLVSIEQTGSAGGAGASASATSPVAFGAAAAAAMASAAHGAPVPPMPPMPPTPPVPPVPPAPPVASTPAVPPVPPIAVSGSPKDLKIQIGSTSEIDEPHKRGQDRTVMGGNVKIDKGQTARDVTVFGGNVDIEGEATGDVTVFGGNVSVRRGARVRGDATVFGGTLALEEGAIVDGDVSMAGGQLKRAPGAMVHGDVSVKGGEVDDDRSEEHGASEPEHSHHGVLRRSLDSVVNSVRIAAVLFVIGTLLLALAGRRMDALRVEAAARPMRSLAVGLLGTFVSIVVLIALCITGIGIPIALVVAILGGFGVLGAMCAVLSVVGEGLLRHRTENPYVHLAVGCGIFVALSAIPVVGYFVVAAVVLAGVGVLVATRGAGFFVRKNGGGGSAYRTAQTV
jgi:hypothetical protein